MGLRRLHSLSLSLIASVQIKVLPLFKDTAKFEPTVGGQKLEMNNILVYYVDEEAPTFTMKNLSGGIIAVIVVVVLAVVAGLLVLVSACVYLFLCDFLYFSSFTFLIFFHFFCPVLCQEASEQAVQQGSGEIILFWFFSLVCLY